MAPSYSSQRKQKRSFTSVWTEANSKLFPKVNHLMVRLSWMCCESALLLVAPSGQSKHAAVEICVSAYCVAALHRRQQLPCSGALLGWSPSTMGLCAGSALTFTASSAELTAFSRRGGSAVCGRLQYTHFLQRGWSFFYSPLSRIWSQFRLNMFRIIPNR